MAVGSGSTALGIHYLIPSDAPDVAGITQQSANDINTLIAGVNALLADTGWVTCTNATGSVTGTAKVRKIGNQVFGQLSLSYTSGWPNSSPGVTAFVLPDASYAPGAAHRMSMGGAVQSTASNIILSCTPAQTSVFIGANGAAGAQVQWNGPLWLVN